MNDLRTLLRQHDPALGARLADEERYRIRAAMFDARPRPVRFWKRVAATVMSLIVLLTMAFGLMRSEALGPSGAEAVAPDRPTAGSPDRQSRRVEYTTPGGTRVIWTLDPSFRM
jgi:hypothetical protein